MHAHPFAVMCQHADPALLDALSSACVHVCRCCARTVRPHVDGVRALIDNVLRRWPTTLAGVSREMLTLRAWLTKVTGECVTQCAHSFDVNLDWQRRAEEFLADTRVQCILRQTTNDACKILFINMHMSVLCST
jgi:hypothetical protein